MNTEKKADRIVMGGFLALVLACFGVLAAWGIASAQTQVEDSTLSDYVYPKSDSGNYELPTFTWEAEGYDDLAHWWDALKEKRVEFEGVAEDAISNYGDYLSEDQQTQLKELENKLLHASSFGKIEEYENQFNEIVGAGESTKADAEAKVAQKAVASSSSSSGGGKISSENYSGSYYQFLRDGIVYSGGNKYSYYSQSVLPGGGLNIPGRHVDGGFVKDGDGYIVLANDKANGTVVDTPFGPGKVYDKGTSGNHYDIYVE